MLETAMAIVRAQGADRLSLPTLAEAAGVSRPIVYDHFDTRPSLLLALYRRLDERHRTATERALAGAPPAPDAIARVMSAAYFACATDMPEFTAVSAALKGDPEMEAIQQEMLDAYADVMAAALAPHSGLTDAALRLRCHGILGAAEAIATEVNRGRTSADDAVTALAGLIVGSIAASPATPSSRVRRVT
nr:TetR/AcrR family transcriptional regulator [Nocardia transvalensis]